MTSTLFLNTFMDSNSTTSLQPIPSVHFPSIHFHDLNVHLQNWLHALENWGLMKKAKWVNNLSSKTSKYYFLNTIFFKVTCNHFECWLQGENVGMAMQFEVHAKRMASSKMHPQHQEGKLLLPSASLGRGSQQIEIEDELQQSRGCRMLSLQPYPFLRKSLIQNRWWFK